MHVIFVCKYISPSSSCFYWYSFHDVDMSVRVRPRGYKLHSCGIEPVQPVKQVCYVYKRFCAWL